MLLEYLQKNYKENEPIFVSDIDLPVTDTNLRQMFKVLCDKGKICRYDTGIYYIKGNSRLKGGITLSASKVAKYKYIARKEQVNGYYSGYTFANLLGLTTQVPYTIEIVSNGASAKCREVILQLLDLLKDFEKYVDVDVYISFFPDRVFKYIYKMRLYKVFR